MSFFTEENKKKPNFTKPPLKKNKGVNDFLQEFGANMPVYKEIVHQPAEPENHTAIVEIGCNCCKIC